MLKRSPPSKGGWERSKRGVALVGVMMFLPMVLFMLAVYTQRALQEQEHVRRINEETRALYLANAALAKAAYQIVLDRQFRGTASAFDVASTDQSEKWQYSVVGQEVHPELGRMVEITTKGTFRGDQGGLVDRNLVVLATPALGRSVLDYAVSAGSHLKMNPGARIGEPTDTDNHVYLGGNLSSPDRTIEGASNTYVYGHVELMTSAIQTSPPVVDPGPIEYGVDELFFPTYDLASLRTKAQNNTQNVSYPGGTHFVGNTVLADETVRGVIYVENGLLTLQGNVQIDGTIVCAGPYGIISLGNLTIDASSTDMVNDAPNVAIVQVGAPKLVLSPGTNVDITGFVFCDGRVQFDADGLITGSIISDGTVEIGTKSVVHFKKISVLDLSPEIQISGRWVLEVEAWVEEPGKVGGSVPHDSSGTTTTPPPPPPSV